MEKPCYGQVHKPELASQALQDLINWPYQLIINLCVFGAYGPVGN